VQELDPDQVLANYKWAFLQCRVDRHLWSRDPQFEMVDPATIERSQICKACSTIRYVWIDRYTTERLTNYRYRHAKGYLTSKTGLQLSDFRERLDRESIEKAFKAGKVHGDLAEQSPAVTLITKAKKAS
jgi:hypothetical protein